MEKTTQKGFFALLAEKVKDLFAHPKKLLPTFILTGVWLLFSLLSAFGANLPVLRFLYTLTYANGGMYGGFFGLVGGIFGKAAFAALVNGIVLALCEKKNPFSGLSDGAKALFDRAVFAGMRDVSPLLLGAGAGLLCCWFFNITSSPVNCAAAVVGAVTAMEAAGKRNGLLCTLVFSVMKMLSKGRTPSRTAVTRVLSGISAGFVLGFALTFVRYGWLLFLAGVLLLGSGIVFGCVSKNDAKRASAAMMLFLLAGNVIFPLFVTEIYADDASAEMVEPVSAFNFQNGGSLYSNDIADAFYRSGVDQLHLAPGFIEYEMNGCYTPEGSQKKLRLDASDEAFTVVSGKDNPYRYDPKISFDALGLVEWDHKIPAGISVDMDFGDLRIVNEKSEYSGYEGFCKLTFGTKTKARTVYHYDLIDEGSGAVTGQENFNDGNVYEVKNETEFGYTLIDGKLYVTFHLNETFYWEVTGVHPTKEVTAFAGTEDYDGSYFDVEYVPYRGRLTYSNGAVNKHGQPFPDLMDFDDDGDIDYADREWQHILVHNPDALDLPGSGAAIVLVSVLTALLGGGGAAVASAAMALLSSGASTVGQTAAEAAVQTAGSVDLPTAEAPDEAQEEAGQETIGSPQEKSDDLGPYIKRDGDGDLNVTDPATGEKRLYTANGDGTYTNPLTGATYTEAELKDSLSSRAENAGLLAQDAAKAQEAITAQRAENTNGQLSQMGQEWLREQAEADAKAEKEAYNEKMWLKYGGEHGNTDSIKEKIGAKQEEAQKDFEHYTERAEAFDTAVTAAEYTQTAADIGVDVLSAATGNTAIKNAYTVGKNFAGRLSDACVNDKDMSGAIAMAGFDSLADIGLDKLENAGFHVTGNMASDSFKQITQNLYEGKDWNDGLGQAAVTGAVKGGIAKGLSAVSDSTQKGFEDQLESCRNAIRLGRIQGMSPKGIDALTQIKVSTFAANMRAEKALGVVTTVAGDLGKNTADGVSEAYTEISETIEKRKG